MKLLQANPLLGNSAPHIYEPVKTARGTFQIKWIDEIGGHALFVDKGQGFFLVASHNNGHSLFSLIGQVQESNELFIKEQLDYIRRCGGTVAAEEFFLE